MKLTPAQEIIRKAVINAALDPRLSIHQFTVEDLCSIADKLEKLLRVKGYGFHRDLKKPQRLEVDI